MKWRTVLCTALFLCGTVLLSACGGGEVPAPAEPPASSEVPAPSQPEEVPAPSESASSSEPEPPASSVPEKENPLIVNGVLKSYDTGKQKDVVLPSGKFTKIDSGCFKNNTTMESVSIPEGVTEIGFAAFSGCYNLKSVQLPKSLIKIGASAFFGCAALQKVEFPENSGLELSNSAFASTGLRELDLPENVKLEDDCVFANCEKLTRARVEIKGEIRPHTFANCISLKTVFLGKEISTIGNSAFECCFALSEINYEGDNKEIQKKVDQLLENKTKSPKHPAVSCAKRQETAFLHGKTEAKNQR